MRHLVMPLLAAAASVLSTGPDDSLGDQLFKVLSDDGAAFDLFGCSVSISGATAIIGARWDANENGYKAGSAYLFDTTTGVQIAKVLAADGVAGDEFGVSVAIDGSTAIVGSLPYNFGDVATRSAYLFDVSDPANPTQIAKLLPDDGEEFDLFGRDVAISGAVAIVGARRDDDNGEGSGSAYIFDTTTGRQIAKLLANDGAVEDLFGRSVAISGSTAIVGAFHDDDNGTNSGSAYLFDTTTGRQIGKLLANDGAVNDLFGYSVAISGTIAIVGAAWDSVDGNVYSGSVYLFDTATGREITKLLPNDGTSSDHFGYSVAIAETTVIVGAEGDDDHGFSSGSAYLFDTITHEQISPSSSRMTPRRLITSASPLR